MIIQDDMAWRRMSMNFNVGLLKSEFKRIENHL